MPCQTSGSAAMGAKRASRRVSLESLSYILKKLEDNMFTCNKLLLILRLIPICSFYSGDLFSCNDCNPK